MRQHLRRSIRTAARFAGRNGVAVLALVMAVSGTGYAATSIVLPTTTAAPAPASMDMAWVKIDGASGRIKDSAGGVFSVRRTTNGTYDVSTPEYRSANCATTVTLHDVTGANRLVAEINESTSKVAVTTYLAYTELNYDADTTVMFACD